MKKSIPANVFFQVVERFIEYIYLYLELYQISDVLVDYNY